MKQQQTGWFFDGETGERQPVLLQLGDEALTINSDRWPSARQWRYADMIVADFLADGGARLQASDGEARLVIGASALGILADHIPALRHRGRQRFFWGRLIAGAAATAAIGALCYLGWPALSDRLAELIPEALLEAIGDAAVADMAQGTRVCGVSAADNILGELTTRIAASVPTPQHVRVRVLDTPVVNAFATPGGNIVVFRGLLDKAESPDEFAGVLAHEIGHLVKHHPQRLLVRYSGLSLLSVALLGNTNFATLGSLVVALAYSRDFESEADEEAIELLAEAKLETGGLARFFARLERDEKYDPGSALRYLASHPPTSERRNRLEQNRRIGAAALSSGKWQELRRICRS